MELNGALSNPQAQVETRRLAAIHADLRDLVLPAPKAPSPRPRRIGVIINAITTVLDLADQAMQAREIHTAAEDLLGEAINWSTVKATLAEHAAGPGARFKRVARGRYRLA